MVLSGAGNRWVDHVRAFAAKNKLSYMCSLSDPECSASYKANKPVKKRGRPPKKAAQQEEAEFDYGDVFEGTPMTEQSLTPPERSSLAKASKAKARKTADRVGMMAEDVNVGSKGRKQVATVVKGRPHSNTPPTLETLEREQSGMSAEDVNIGSVKGRKRVVKAKVAKVAKKAKVAKPSGRPRKYADVEEARKANIQKTNENRKKYVSQRKVPIKPKKLTKDERRAEDLIQHVMTKKGITREQAIEQIRENNESFRREVDKELAYLQQPVRRAVPEITLASVTVPKGRGKKPTATGGRKKKGYSIHNFVQDINKANPVMWGIQNHPNVGIKLGQVTNDNLLPAVVAVGKPVYDATAIATATTLTGNPLLGKVVADEFWNAYGKPYDPRDRQDNEALKVISEKVGQAAGKEAKAIGSTGGATAQQRGIAAQLRSFFTYKDNIKFGKNLKYFANMLSAIVHSAEYPTDRMGEENKYGVDIGSKSNIFRDYNNKYDDRAEQFIKRSLEFIRDNPSTFYPPDYYDSLIPKKLSVAAPVFKPSGGNISMTIDSDSDSDDDMSGINWSEISDALGGGLCQSTPVVPTMHIEGYDIPINVFPRNIRNPPSIRDFARMYNATHSRENITALQLREIYHTQHIAPLLPYAVRYIRNLTPNVTPYGSDISENSEYDDVNFANTLQ